MTIERLWSLACHLIGVLENSAQLSLSNDTSVAKELSQLDMNETQTHFEFDLVSSSCLACSITYWHRTISSPCHSAQLKLFEELSISCDGMKRFEVVVFEENRVTLTLIHYLALLEKIMIVNNFIPFCVHKKWVYYRIEYMPTR